MKATFDLSSSSEVPDEEVIPPAEAKNRKSAARATGSFLSLTAVLSGWSPADPKASRRHLVSEIRTTLEEREHKCIGSCIPALIVDGSYPIEVMHYHGDEDINEFLARMLWLHQEFRSSIGIFVGVPDEQTAKMIEDDCNGLLSMDENCVVLLV